MANTGHRGRKRRRIELNRDESQFAEEGWTSNPNKLLRDVTLSAGARFAFCWMQTNETGFMITADDLAEAGGVGVHKAEDWIYELEAAGWLTRHQTRNNLGHITGVKYTLKARQVLETERTAKPRKPKKVRSSFSKKPTTDTGQDDGD